MTREGSEALLVRGLSTLMLDVVEPFSVAMARHIHEHVGALGGLENAATVESTRAAAEANMREVLSTLRAGLPASAHETPVEALEHARFLQSRGVGLGSVIELYQYGLAMFRAVVVLELLERVPDEAARAAIASALDGYVFAYIARVSNRLVTEYGLTEGGWYPDAADPVFANPETLDAARRFRDERIADGAWVPDSPERSQARDNAERALRSFAATVEEAARNPELSHRVSLAATTVGVTLADEPDLSLTLLLDRDPVAIADGGVEADAAIWIASVDLNRLWSHDFYLAMAIAKGRVRMAGPVRRLLRVIPIMRVMAAEHRALEARLQIEAVR
jgi:hypothetical protein